MMLNIGKRIKDLRKSQDVTQEKLADYLNISYQSVSKWENGLALPDLTLIPALSNFFGVSADYLLDIGPETGDAGVKKYIDDAAACSHTGRLQDGIAVIRSGLKVYPNDHRLLGMLVDYLFGIYCTDADKRTADEIIKIAQLILTDCTDDDIRINTLQFLAYTYNISGQQEKAVETAQKLPSATVNRNSVLADIIMPMSERRRCKQECMLADFEGIINNILWLGGLCVGNKGYRKAIDIYSRANAMIKEFADEGLFLLRLASAYAGMSMCYSGLNDTISAYEYIEKVRNSYKRFEDLLLKGTARYTSPLLSDLSFKTNDLNCNFDVTEHSEYSFWYRNMCETYNAYDAVRKDKRFPSLCRQIEDDLEHYKQLKKQKYESDL